MLKKIIDHEALHDHQTVNVSSNFLYCSGEKFHNTQLKTILCLSSKTGQRKPENRKDFRRRSLNVSIANLKALDCFRAQEGGE